MSWRILVVEDEPKVLRFVTQALVQSGMHVEAVSDLSDIEAFLRRTPFHVLVLDRLLGRADSLAVLPRLRQEFPELKVLVLSALGDLDDRVSGLQMGADDYLAKPFHVSELVARVQALIRRNGSEKASSRSIQCGDLDVQLDTQEVHRAGERIILTSKEFKLLVLFVQHPHRIYSRTELLDLVWGINADPQSNVVEVTINRLRSKIKTEKSVALIHTKRGGGYWFGENRPND